MTYKINWLECDCYSYSDNFNSVELSFTEKGFHFSFYNESKCDGETLDVEFHGDFMIVINQEGNGSYGVFTTDMIPANLTRDEVNKYMTKLAAGWIVEFANYYLEKK